MSKHRRRIINKFILAFCFTGILSTPLLAVTAELKGTVKDMSNPGVAISNACVTAFTDACDYWDMRIADARTDNTGEYTITVPPGPQYYIHVNPQCNGSQTDIFVPEFWNSAGGDRDCNEAGPTPATDPNNPVENINFQLEDGGKIEGTAYNSTTGYAIDGDTNDLAIAAYTGNACGAYNYVSESHIMMDGRYSIYGLDLNSDYILKVINHGSPYAPEWFAGFSGPVGNLVGDSNPDCGAAATVHLDSTTHVVTGANFNLEEGGTIQGVLSEEGVPINGIDNQMGVDVYAGFACDNYPWLATDNIDGNGSYTIQGLDLNSTYFVQTYSDGAPYEPRWFAGFDDTTPLMSTDCAEATPLTFESPNTQIDQIDFDYEKSALIKGTVLGYDNSPLQGACVRAITVNCSNWSETTVGEASTVTDGSYSMRVPEGDGFYIHVGPGCSQNETANLSGYWAGGTNVIRDCNQAIKTDATDLDTPVTGVDFNLQEGTVIKGNVSLRDGESTQALMNVCVNILGGTPCSNSSWTDSGHTDNNGDYHAVVPFGQEYYLQTEVSCGNYQSVNKYWNNNTDKGSYYCNEATNIPKKYSGDPDTVADFELEQAEIISGQVKDESTSQGVGNIGVFVQLGTCNNAATLSNTTTSTATESLGEYEIFVPPGLDVYLESCVNCENNNSSYMDVWYWDTGVTEKNCDNATPVTGPAVDINLILLIDTDGDEVSDNDENTIYLTNPNNPDSDGDGIDDGGEVFLWGNDYNGNIDAPADSIWNIHETDADNDGVSDLQELARGGDFKDPNNTPDPLVLYDDFSSGALDPNKWTPHQYAMEVDSGALRLFLDAPYKEKMAARLLTTTDENFKTTFTIDELTKYASDELGVYYSMLGLYYSENSDPNLVTGRVYTSVCFGDRGNGLEVWYYILKATDEDWNDEVVTEGVIVPAGNPALLLNTQYSMELLYNGVDSFTYRLYNSAGGEIAFVTANGPQFGSSIDKHLSPRVITPSSGGRVSATVTQVETSIGTAPYAIVDTSFDNPPLTPDFWSTPEVVKEITTEGKLKILTHSGGDKITTHATLRERFNYIETKVIFDGSKILTNPGTASRARLSGYLYNDSRGPNSGLPYNGFEGNVWGQVFIQYSETYGLQVKVGADRTLDAEDTSWENLFWEELELPFTLAFNTEYTIYMGFAGDIMILGIYSPTDDKHAMYGHMVETPKFLPYQGSLSVNTRVYGNGSEVLQVAYFDDIKVSGDPLEKDGDLNVDGNVDLKDAILGLKAITGTDTGDVWSAGDVDGDNLIGLSEVINILDQNLAP